MSRSGYVDDWGDQWGMIRWRGAVKSAISGKRGQAFLREMLAALDKIESKRLISHELCKDGEVCAIGAVGLARGTDMSGIDPEDHDSIAGQFGISRALAQEIVFENDEAAFWGETPETRYMRMRQWVQSLITAQGIEAGTAETRSGSVHESPTPQGDAP